MKYTLLFRLWHWLNAFVVLALLGTVFLRKTFLSWRTNAELIVNKLTEIQISISQDQAVSLAKAIRAGMWEWHIYLGFVLASLVVFRIYLYIAEHSKNEPFQTLSLHKKLVKLLYIVVYGVLIFMSISGLVMYFSQSLGMDKELIHSIKEVHEFVYYYVLFFVPLHLAGVVMADNTTQKGLISTMINGKKSK